MTEPIYKLCLIRGYTEGFDVGRCLPLPGCLLQQFVGDVVAREGVADAEAKLIVGRDLAAVVEREVALGAGVGVVLRNDGVQVMVGSAAAAAAAQRVPAPDVLALCVGA